MRSGSALRCGIGLSSFAGGGARATWLRFNQLSEYRHSGLEIVLQTKHRQRDCFRVGANEADYADATPTWRGSDGDDGVVEIHGEIVIGGTLRAGSAERVCLPACNPWDRQQHTVEGPCLRFQCAGPHGP